LCRDAAWRRYFFQAEDGIRDRNVTGVQTCALPISRERGGAVPPRVLEQRLGDLQELLLRRAADLLYHLRRVAAEVFLQELEHAARMLERRVRLRRALAQRAEHVVEGAALLDHFFGGGTGRL